MEKFFLFRIRLEIIYWRKITRMQETKDLSSIENLYSGSGLSGTEIAARQKQYGFNEIPEKKETPVFGLLKRMWGPIPWLLEAAMIFELILGKGVQAGVIFLLLVFSAVVGQIQENRAKKAIGYLNQQLQIRVRCLREGEWLVIPSKELAIGDVVHLKVGDIVPADMVIKFGTVDVDESVLTGESREITKELGEVLHSASTINHGEVIAEVTAIGKNSTYGKTAELVRTAEAPGRLQTLLFNIVRYLAYLDIVLAIILIITASIQGTAWQELLPFLVILFIATIPISMPSSFVVANSLEANNLAKNGVLVTDLTGIQEAASMEVLLVDKTGTITNNRPEIAKLVSFNKNDEKDLLRLAAAASDETSTNSINTAIFNACKKQKLEQLKRLSFKPFDPIKKYSSAVIQKDDTRVEVVLGSPAVISKFALLPDDFSEQVDSLSNSGARVLVVASGSNNKFIANGLIAMNDSPREDAFESIERIKNLGIRVVLLTGDTAGTARAIAEQVGIGDRIGTLQDALSDPLNFDGFANVYPEDKYEIVKAFQKTGLVVGMTGDGINDAPALKQADVGIAVSSAADVAKLAARVVLTRPRLSDIASVIVSGHRVYRRMMTWTITKLARTAELAALLTFGLIFTGFFPVSLSLIVFIVVMNDMVTLTLGTDNAWPTVIPEKWDMPRLAKISAIFTIGWLLIGLGLLLFFLKSESLPPDQISTLMFLYLIYSAMATIFMTRTRDAFWTYAPSNWVTGMVLFNLVMSTLMASFGWLMAPVSIKPILIILTVTLLSMFALDKIKSNYYQRTGILGTEQQS